MGKTFAAAHELILSADENEGYGLIKEMLDGLRQGRYMVDGIPIDMSPGELFHGSDRLLTHAYAFRLVSVEPAHYAISFTCFDDMTLGLIDFSVILGEAHRYLIESDVERSKDGMLQAPIEGGLLLYCNGETSSIDAIAVYPPHMTAEAFQVGLAHSLYQGVTMGFGCDTEE